MGAREAAFRRRRTLPMKTARTFKGSWFLVAVVAAILVGELGAWELSSYFGWQNNPLLVGFISVGLVSAIASVLFEGADFK